MNYTTESGLHVVSQDFTIVRGGGSRELEDVRLAQAARLIIQSDLHTTGHGDNTDVELLNLLKAAHESSGGDGNRYELALIDLLTRKSGPKLHDAVQQAFMHATDNSLVLDSLQGGARLRIIGLIREKARAMKGSVVAQSADDIAALLADDARLITPAARTKFTHLLPAADRGKSAGTRLSVLFETKLGKDLPLFPDSSKRLQHSDLLVGTPDGRYWLGADVKTSRLQRPDKRVAYPGIGLHVDVLFGDNFDWAAQVARVSGDDRWFAEPSGSHQSIPRLTVGTAHDAFSAMVDARRALAWAWSSESRDRPHGGKAWDRLASLIKDHLGRPCGELLKALDERVGDSVLRTTPAEISKYGDADAPSIVGAIG